MKKLMIMVILLVGMLSCLTGCNEKPLEVRDHVTINVDGKLQEVESVYYILHGEIVDKDGNPLGE